MRINYTEKKNRIIPTDVTKYVLKLDYKHPAKKKIKGYKQLFQFRQLPSFLNMYKIMNHRYLTAQQEMGNKLVSDAIHVIRLSIRCFGYRHGLTFHCLNVLQICCPQTKKYSLQQNVVVVAFNHTSAISHH